MEILFKNQYFYSDQFLINITVNSLKDVLLRKKIDIRDIQNFTKLFIRYCYQMIRNSLFREHHKIFEFIFFYYYKKAIKDFQLVEWKFFVEKVVECTHSDENILFTVRNNAY